MSAEIYYFSASGNSLAVARDLAKRLPGQLISIPAVMERTNVFTDADVLGLVFPVYYANLGGSGVPLIVERFVGKLREMSSKYIFAVCTHSGAPGATVENLGQMLAAWHGRLAAGFTVKMSTPYPTAVKLGYFLCHRPLTINSQGEAQERQQLAAAWEEKLEAICRRVSARRIGPLETRCRAAKVLLAPLAVLQHRAAIARYQKLAHSSSQTLADLIPLADRSFRCGPHCSGCGTCARVCPADNIRMVDRKPVWQHHCETCYACYQWCPQGAIHGDIVEYEKRHHHPSVKLADMLG